MGIRDYLDVPNALFLFEWPSKGGDDIPDANIVIQIEKSEDDVQRFITFSLENAALYECLKEKL